MKPHRTSLKDLAKHLGVSIATVSRALRNSHEVSDEMKERVQKLAKELNYRPNPFAQSLRKEAPRVIGVVVPNLVTHYYAAVLDGIEEYAMAQGYSVISSNTHEDFEREAKALDNFVSLHVEGIIACLTQTTEDYQPFIEINNLDMSTEDKVLKIVQDSATPIGKHVVRNALFGIQKETIDKHLNKLVSAGKIQLIQRGDSVKYFRN